MTPEEFQEIEVADNATQMLNALNVIEGLEVPYVMNLGISHASALKIVRDALIDYLSSPASLTGMRQPPGVVQAVRHGKILIDQWMSYRGVSKVGKLEPAEPEPVKPTKEQTRRIRRMDVNEP